MNDPTSAGSGNPRTGGRPAVRCNANLGYGVRAGCGRIIRDRKPPSRAARLPGHRIRRKAPAPARPRMGLRRGAGRRRPGIARVPPPAAPND